MKVQTTPIASVSPRTDRPKQPSTPPDPERKQTYTPSPVRKTLGKIAKGAGHYLGPAAIAALPATATVTALALGGPTAVPMALLGTMLVGGLAGAVAWTRDIGPIRAFTGGSLVSAMGGVLGLVGGPCGMIATGAIGAGRQMMFDVFADQ